MKFRHRITGMIVTADRELSERRYERIDVDDLDVLLFGVTNDLACECGFVAKSAGGLTTHQRSHE